MPPFRGRVSASVGDLVDQGKEHAAGGAEAVAGHATLASAPAERRGLAAVLEQTADRLGQRGDVAGRHDETGSFQDLGDHRHRGGYDRTAERHGVEDLRRYLTDGVARRTL